MKMHSASRKTNYRGWSYAIGAGIVLFPLTINRVDFRSAFNRGLAVSADKSSPAYAAFEDATTSFTESEAKPTGPAISLNGDDVGPLPVAMPQQRRVALGGLKIQPPPPAPVPTPKGEPVLVAAPAPAPVITAVAARAEALVAKDLASHPAPPNMQILRAKSGTQILVARPVAAMPLAASPPKAELPPPLPTLARVSEVDSARALWLNGQLEMTGGLAFVGPETQLVIKRVVNGESRERGQIWITEGRFEIQVDRAAGYLVAELRKPDGQVLGRGELDLLNLNASGAGNTRRITDLRIALRPTNDVASLRAVSAYSHAQQILPVADARIEVQAHRDPLTVNEEGVMSDPSLTRDSTFVARATAKKNWSTLVVGQSEHPQDIRLFSNSLIEALIALSARDKNDASKHAIVWGQVAKAGHLVTGAHVEMAGDAKPIYFDSAYLPDEHLTATSANGLFAFVNVAPGVQAVRISHDRHLYPAQVFPTEDRHVSYLEFDLRDQITSRVRLLDAFDATKPIAARVKLVGTEDELRVDGESRVRYAVAADTFMMEADAGPEYAVSRVTLSGTPHDVPIPLVRRDWLEALRTDRAIVSLKGQGTIAGFVDDQGFEVDLTGLGAPSSAHGAPPPQLVYVDASGHALPGHTGIAGGGFVIFNAPLGMQTVYLHPAQSRESFSQVVVPEMGVVHMMTWSKR